MPASSYAAPGPDGSVVRRAELHGSEPVKMPCSIPEPNLLAEVVRSDHLEGPSSAHSSVLIRGALRWTLTKLTRTELRTTSFWRVSIDKCGGCLERVRRYVISMAASPSGPRGQLGAKQNCPASSR